MGFTTGLLGGFTLTATILYLSTSLNTRNRNYQSTLLRQQSHVLSSIVEPQPAQQPPTVREVDAGLVETAKDKWNAELEGNLRKVQEMDWSGVRDRIEEGVSRVWRTAFEKSREVVEK